MELDIYRINIAMWVIVGIITGIIIHLADPKDSKGGVLLTSIFGVAGAVMTAFFYSIFFGLQTTGFDFSSFLMAMLGGLFVAFAQRLMLRKEEKINENVYYEPWFSPFFSEQGQKGGQSSIDKSEESIINLIEENIGENVEIKTEGNGIKKNIEEENIRWF